ncbi:MAG: hypothetical protein ACSLEL_03345 [Candidatus Malihini olakiniferum]
MIGSQISLTELRSDGDTNLMNTLYIATNYLMNAFYAKTF